ncbi:hypothetical protein A4A49_00340 [Nicotiana attenuata]|uniref:CCHC-type domain-containing protein n=1 Tax=Nicotiana attenuata TaxID=49451 RepID=A0A314LCM8_NICAT|nr:hypothetical protein A4A49_00340 [Nicotiana attenuata]
MVGGNAELREKVAALEALVGTVDGDQFLTIATHGSDFSTTSKSKNGNKDKAKEWRKNGNDKGNAVEGNSNEKGKQCAGPSTKWGQNSKFDGCFICTGPHMARDCPRIEKLSALFAEEKCEDEPNEEELEQTTAYVGPMVVLKNAEATSSRTTNSSGGGELREKVAALEALVGTVDGDQFLTIVTLQKWEQGQGKRVEENENDKGNAVEGNSNEKGNQCAGPSTKWGQNSKIDGCFICKGPHMERDCPRIEKLSALFAEGKCEDEPNEEELEQTTAYVGPMVVLKNAEATSSRTTNSSGGGGLLAP